MLFVLSAIHLPEYHWYSILILWPQLQDHFLREVSRQMVIIYFTVHGGQG